MRALTIICLIGFSLSACAPQLDSADACPTGEDIKDGIVFERENRNKNKYYYYQRQIDDNHLWRSWELRWYNSQSSWSNNPWHTIYYRGLLELSQVKNSGKYPRTDTYKDNIEVLFPLKLGSVYEFEIDRRGINRSKPASQVTKKITVAEKEKYKIGECQYDVFRIDIEEIGPNKDGSKFREKTSLLYSTELGTILWSSRIRAGSGWPDGYSKIRKRKEGDLFLSPLSPDSPKSEFNFEASKTSGDILFDALVRTTGD